jgi:hypothetical protein
LGDTSSGLTGRPRQKSERQIFDGEFEDVWWVLSFLSVKIKWFCLEMRNSSELPKKNATNGKTTNMYAVLKERPPINGENGL